MFHSWLKMSELLMPEAKVLWLTRSADVVQLIDILAMFQTL